MGLQGRLEDLPLPDILQVVAFAKKTGRLVIDAPQGRGGVAFKEGMVVCAYSWSTRELVGRIGEESGRWSEEHIELSLRELASLREGKFDFELTEDVPRELGGLDVSRLVLERGVNAQQLLLDLARRMDEDRRDTQALLESGLVPEEEGEGGVEVGAPELGEPAAPPVPSEPQTTAPPAPPAPIDAAETAAVESGLPSVVVADDEPIVREIVAAGLEARGFRVAKAEGPKATLAAARALGGRGGVVVVADLRMPTSTGRSFWGGLEVARDLKRDGAHLPVVLMAETISDRAKARARKLGVRRIVFKPGLSKLDRAQYEQDLRSFADVVARTVAEIGGDADPAREAERIERENERLLEFLNGMIERLSAPHRSKDISRMVLQVGQRYFERGILFLVKRHEAVGLAGFGLARTERESVRLAQRLRVDLEATRALLEVVRRRRAGRYDPELTGFGGTLYRAIGRGKADECALLPMVANGDVVAVLYGDNPRSGRRIPSLRGAELFLAHAGMAMENLFLSQRLREFEARVAGAARQGAGTRPAQDLPRDA